ncbi:YhcB family protein [Stutzerimonas tarimensis]|uniref:Z-ring associated protein G n=1 Tax=Stutzerimonas tarimensis TaxID=1507735 RepID=A0ABV7T5I9_9GAMM
MEQNLTTWLLPIIGVAIGIGIGFLLGRNNTPGRNQHQINELQERFDTYQSEVVTHFNTTASLLHKLASTQQDIQEHLSEGAHSLALDEQTRERLLSALQEGNHASRDKDRERISAPLFTEAPKDYAPKDADAPGTLHEEFGLKSRH